MDFKLFSQINFSISDPILLVEACCIQSDFYINYDAKILEGRDIYDVNKIGARTKKKILDRCANIINENPVKISNHTLYSFQNLCANDQSQVFPDGRA